MAAILDKSEYLFVKGADIDATHPYGDMDRLKTSFNPNDPIRGVIMPKRTGFVVPGIRGKQVLSGEDVCFLSEGVRERQVLTTTSAMGSTDIEFSRKIAGKFGVVTAAPWYVANSLSGLAPSFVKTFPTSGVYDVADADMFTFYSAADMTSSVNDFSLGHKLQMANVQKLFDDEETLATGAVEQTHTYYDPAGETIQSTNYDDDYPVPVAGVAGNTIMWTGGSDHSGSGGSAHAYGGRAISSINFRPYISLPNVPAAMTPEEGSIWLNWHLSYTYTDPSGNITRSTTTYCQNAGYWSWDANLKLAFKWMGTYFARTVLMSVASAKFGWDVTQMPDEYGTKVITVDSITMWLTFPVSHTDFWTSS